MPNIHAVGFNVLILILGIYCLFLGSSFIWLSVPFAATILTLTLPSNYTFPVVESLIISVEKSIFF